MKPEYMISPEICSYYVDYGEQSGVMNCFNSKAPQTDNLRGYSMPEYLFTNSHLLGSALPTPFLFCLFPCCYSNALNKFKFSKDKGKK